MQSKTRWSAIERTSLMYSACAHTSGIADAGRAAELQELLGDSVLVPDLLRNQSDAHRELLHRAQIGRRVSAGRQLVVAALARQQRPQPSHTPPLERRAILALPVAVVVVAVPARAGRRLCFQHRVDDAH